MTAIDWAKTATFDAPVSMGTIEREVQTRPLVDPPGRGAVPAWIVWTVLALPTFAPAVGSILLFANPWAWGGEPAWSVEFSLDAFAAGFLLGALFAVAAVVTWASDGRQRSAVSVSVLATTAVTSAIAAILLRLPGFAGPGPELFTVPVLLAIGSTVALVVVLVASKPPAEPSEIERFLDGLDRDGRRQLYNRTEVLRILVQRGVIPRDKMSGAIYAPLGGWRDLD